MAVTKIWAIHDSVSRVVDYCTNPSKTKLSDLEQVLLYAADKEKTLDEGEQQYAVTGIGCRAESAAREMAAVQRSFGKAGGNVAYHAYQSFKTGEVTAEECHRIGVQLAAGSQIRSPRPRMPEASSCRNPRERVRQSRRKSCPGGGGLSR